MKHVLIIGVLALARLGLTACIREVDTARTQPEETHMSFASVTRSTPVRDVMDNPVFGDYGRLLFPVDRTIPDGLPHGFGLGERTAAEGWIDRAIAFWERQMEAAAEEARFLLFG